jgi:hypothetical protein
MSALRYRPIGIASQRQGSSRRNEPASAIQQVKLKHFWMHRFRRPKTWLPYLVSIAAYSRAISSVSIKCSNLNGFVI